jgi:predicted kinase
MTKNTPRSPALQAKETGIVEPESLQEKTEQEPLNERVATASGEPKWEFLKDPNELTDEEKIMSNQNQVIVVCGLIGSGKSYVANQLSHRIGKRAKIFASDYTREQMYQRAQAAGEQIDKYSTEMSGRTYARLFEDAVGQAKQGIAVVDATFWEANKRLELEERVRKDLGEEVPIKYVYVDAEDEVARQRIDRRWAEKTRSRDLQELLTEERERILASEADYSHRLRDKKRWDSFTSTTIRIDNSSDDSQTLQRQLDLLIIDSGDTQA